MANQIGGYELISELGSGAMGKVYLARDSRLDREVALKVLWPQLAEQPAAVARFEREARAVARLKHANVVAVHDIGAADGYHYLAMEYVAGCSLRELLKQPLPVEKTLHYFKQILAGLGVAHEQGVIHRDLKPGNILIETATDTVKLADFGLARIIEEEISITQSGEMLGTLEYMAPELSRGESAGCKSDLYAAGVVLYRLLTGRFPFQGATPSAILKAHECGTYPPASKITAGLPAQADGILARLLACEPANRYADCQAVFADLQRWEKGEDIPLEFATTYEPIDHAIERHRVPGWKRAWVRVASWYRYQWLEAFNRTDLTVVRVQNEVRAMETELGKARRRMEEATLLRNRVRARSDEARALMQKCEQAAELAHAADDETRTRQHLAAKLEAQERAEDLDKEAAESEQVLKLARQEFESRSVTIADQRHNADLLLARRRRAKLEMSVLGVLPVGERRLGERVLAGAKLFGPLLIVGFCFQYLLRSSLSPLPPVSDPSPVVQEQRPLVSPGQEAPAAQTAAARPPVAVATNLGGGWGRVAPMQLPRAHVGVAVLDGLLYAFGGFVKSSAIHYINGNDANIPHVASSVEMFNPLTNKWSSRNSLPLPNSEFAALVVNNRIFAVGGGDGNRYFDQISEYDPRTDSWRTVAQITSGQKTPSVAVLNGRLYLLGGVSGAGNAVATVTSYEVATGTWRQLAPLNMRREFAAAAAVNGKIYVIGGHRDEAAAVFLDSVEEYDPQTGRWTARSPLRHRRSNIQTAAAVVNNKIYVFGGWDGGSAINSVVECYDPARDNWTDVTTLPSPRNNLTAVALGKTIYVLGGQDMVANTFATVETYTPDS